MEDTTRQLEVSDLLLTVSLTDCTHLHTGERQTCCRATNGDYDQRWPITGGCANTVHSLTINTYLHTGEQQTCHRTTSTDYNQRWPITGGCAKYCIH